MSYFQAKDIYNLNFIVAEFNRNYDRLSRNSGRCHSVWLGIKQYEAIENELKKLFHKNFSFSYRERFEPNFLARRANDKIRFVRPLYQLFSSALFFLKEFIDRRKETGYVTQYTLAKSLTEASESYRIASGIKSLLTEWRQNLLDTEFDRLSGGEFSENLEEFYMKQVRGLKIYAGTRPLFEELREKLSIYKQLPFSSMDEDRLRHFQILYKAAIDTNNCLKHPHFKLLLDEVKQVLDRWGVGDNINDDVIQGLQSLGPFGVNTLSLEDKEALNFEGTLKTCSFNGRSNEVFLTSPKANVSINDPPTREHLKIPDSATYFQFVYPVSKNVTTPVSDTPYENLKSYGGYVYFNSKQEMVQINALSPNGTDLYFIGPSVVSEEHKTKINNALKEKRFKNVTVRQLYDAGARLFAWFRPGELGTQNHGCFVYKYDENTDWPITAFEVINIGMGQSIQEIEKLQEKGLHNVVELHKEFVFKRYDDEEIKLM